jgi:hypothetical protein
VLSSKSFFPQFNYNCFIFLGISLVILLLLLLIGILCVFIVMIRDKLELKAIKDGSVNYAALEKKAELYDKLVRGELSDEEDKEKYCVDFARKGDDHDDVSDTPNVLQENERGGADDDGDGDAFSRFNLKSVGLGRSAGVVDNDEHKRNVRYAICCLLKMQCFCLCS